MQVTLGMLAEPAFVPSSALCLLRTWDILANNKTHKSDVISQFRWTIQVGIFELSSWWVGVFGKQRSLSGSCHVWNPWPVQATVGHYVDSTCRNYGKRSKACPSRGADWCGSRRNHGLAPSRSWPKSEIPPSPRGVDSIKH